MKAAIAAVLLGVLACLLGPNLALAQEPVDIAIGTATVTSGTTVVEPHTLSDTPESVLVTATNARGAVFWLSDIGDTTFTINLPTEQGGDATFMWLAYDDLSLGDGDHFRVRESESTVAAGSSTGVVVHDLGVTPDFVAIQPVGAGSQVLWVSDISGTHFTVNLPTGQPADVAIRWMTIKREDSPTGRGLAHLTDDALIPQSSSAVNVTHDSGLVPRMVFVSPLSSEGSVFSVPTVNEDIFRLELPTGQPDQSDYQWTILTAWPVFIAEAPQVIQPVAGEIPPMEQRDTAERQRNLPLMDVAADVEDRTGYPFVRLILAISAGAFILIGAWFFSQLSPENPVPAWAFILVASLLSLGFGALGWLSFIAIALYSSGIVAFSHRTPA